MIKTLTKHGNSYAMIIDKPILELLQIEPNTPLEVTTNGDQLVITPLRDHERQAKLDKALSKINSKFGKSLKKLTR